jgi:predicted TIM-barrel fold metal-dependent hydrolase
MPFKPPALACDSHCHVFGPAAKFPYDPKAAYRPEDAPFEQLAVLHRRLGLERAVIVHASCHGADMRATLDAIARSGGRYRGTAIIDPAARGAGVASHPAPRRAGPGRVRRAFPQMAPDPSLQKRILVDNSARLYGF